MGRFCTPRHFSSVILNAHIWLTQPLRLDHQNFSEALHDCYSEKKWFGLVRLRVTLAVLSTWSKPGGFTSLIKVGDIQSNVTVD